jgi:hypothetical protein
MHDRWGNNNRQPKHNKFRNEGPFEIEIKGESTIAKYNRNKDVVHVQEFNAQIQAWGASVKASLIESIGVNIKEDKKLSKSLKNNYYSENKPNSGRLMEIDRIGFSFEREGVFVHMGVGRGYRHDGTITSKQHKMNADKQNKMGRKPVIWFNPVIEQHISELSKIVETYADGLVLNYSQIYISE